MKFLILALIFASSVTQANIRMGRESGGGEVFGDTLNPWFLENTETVSYCIEVDTTHFGAPVELIETLVDSAINTWKVEFSKAHSRMSIDKDLQPFGMVRVATQNFTKEVCRPSTMLRFQFGVLSADQRSQYLPSPNEVIGEAIRTAYDPVNLRGKGFVYVAPSAGPLRPTGVSMAQNPWKFQNGALLKRVLMHELGHVFGLPHSGRAYDLMGLTHPEYVVQQSSLDDIKNPEAFAKYLSKIDVLGFDFPYTQEQCAPAPDVKILGNDNRVQQFFGFPEGTQCYKFILFANRFEAYASSGQGMPYKLIGKSMPQESRELRQSLSRIKLTPEQKVFTHLPENAIKTGYLQGTDAVVSKVFTSTYQSEDRLHTGATKVIVSSVPMHFEMEAILNGNFVQVF